MQTSYKVLCKDCRHVSKGSWSNILIRLDPTLWKCKAAPKEIDYRSGKVSLTSCLANRDGNCKNFDPK